MQFSANWLLSAMLLVPSLLSAASPFLGNWDFTNSTPGTVGANWLGVAEKNGSLDIWFQPTGGHVFEVKDFKVNGLHLTLHPSANFVLELDAAGGKLTGTEKRGDQTTMLSAVRAPELNRAEPKAWTKPEALFNRRNLDGWEPIGDPSKSHWVVENGELVNKEHGANLRTTRTFNDFKAHFEVNCPEDANSGIYLRGRYELQLEYVKPGSEPPERSMGSIYGRIAPSVELPRKPGQWETFDITLVGRTLTVARDGVTTIDHKKIEGITGGALDANEGEPGPFYIQGDHTGGLKFRNITVAIPKK
jgi:hypothetical protein